MQPYVSSSLLVLLLALVCTVSCSDDTDMTPAPSATSTQETSGDTTQPSDVSDEDTDESDTRDNDVAEDSSNDTLPDAPLPEATPEQRAARDRFQNVGPYPAGNITVTLTDPDRDRTLRIEIWYPATEDSADAAAQGAPLSDFGTTPEDIETLTNLLAAAPEGCPTPQTRSARDSNLSTDGTFPLVLFSHCLQCTRFSSFSVAQHMATHGFIVAAPDHTSDTLFDKLNNAPAQLTPEFLQTRSSDILFVLDSLLDPNTDLPQPITASIDTEKLGVMGHSFGAVTTGLSLQRDTRLKAGLALAAPLENPLFPNVSLSSIQTPLLLLVATEDNSISEFGNQIMRFNFNDANPPVWKLEAKDAGHWSFSDICALHESFNPGCGEDTRQTNTDETFAYIPVADGISIASTTATAFFSAHLNNDPEGLQALVPALSDEALDIQHRLEE